MTPRLLGFLSALIPTLVLAAAPAELCLSDARGLKVADARLFEGTGPYRAPKVSSDAQAQRFFEQGMVFGWGFNFAEAARSFRAAVLRDPDCAMCRWGIAWAVGPNINSDMAAADLPVARDALVQAGAYATDARSRALVAALATRLPAKGETIGAADARRYSEAMIAIAGRWPDDPDLAVLAAEAVMTEHSYDWWRDDGKPQPWTPRVVALLDRAAQLSPDHPGAHHYRIHLYGESSTPASALDSAQRLAPLAPGVGHLVHMPAHIYIRVGRYHEAVQANKAAVDADRRYAALTQPDPQYVAGYAVHNQHFLWAAALWSGESALALSTADAVAAAAAASERVDPGTRQHLTGLAWLTDVRFARWDAILARPVAPRGAYLKGLAAYARGMAHARTGDVAGADRELTALRAARHTAAAENLMIKNTNRAADVLAVAEALLRAETAATRRQWTAAMRHAKEAVKREQALKGDEPPVWPLPALQVLARTQLAAGSPRAALESYGRDLRQHPENAYSLLGSAEAQRRLADAGLAEATRARALVAWSHADVPVPLP
jgi:tetratricopeptide (TPR) repeat protein